MTALWAQEAADRFWAGAGGAPAGFPRDLRRAVALSLPLAVVDLPRLRIGRISAWLARRGVSLVLAERNRAVRACLLARGGSGIIFLDGADPDDERRVSLAHEVAHFLVEDALRRERAVARLGPAVLPALYGERAASATERVAAVLAGVKLRLQVHLLERTPDGHADELRLSVAEHQADELAFELLAPAETARAYLARTGHGSGEEVLQHVFGLPAAVARAYALRLAPERAAEEPFLARLGVQARRVEVRSPRGKQG